MSQQAVEAVQEGEDNQPRFTGTPPLLSIIVGMDQVDIVFQHQTLRQHIHIKLSQLFFFLSNFVLNLDMC